MTGERDGRMEGAITYQRGDLEQVSSRTSAEIGSLNCNWWIARMNLGKGNNQLQPIQAILSHFRKEGEKLRNTVRFAAWKHRLTKRLRRNLRAVEHCPLASHYTATLLKAYFQQCLLPGIWETLQGIYQKTKAQDTTSIWPRCNRGDGIIS